MLVEILQRALRFIHLEHDLDIKVNAVPRSEHCESFPSRYQLHSSAFFDRSHTPNAIFVEGKHTIDVPKEGRDELQLCSKDRVQKEEEWDQWHVTTVEKKIALLSLFPLFQCFLCRFLFIGTTCR